MFAEYGPQAEAHPVMCLWAYFEHTSKHANYFLVNKSNSAHNAV